MKKIHLFIMATLLMVCGVVMAKVLLFMFRQKLLHTFGHGVPAMVLITMLAAGLARISLQKLGQILLLVTCSGSILSQSLLSI